LEKGLSGASREELRRLVEPYLNSVEATEARSQLAKRRLEASTQPLFAETLNMRSREQRWPFSTTVAYWAVDGLAT
jgi:hypothetical protein